MSKIIPFIHVKQHKAQCVDNTRPAVQWPVQDLEQPDGDEWLLAAVEGSRCEGAALSIWAHHPNLKQSTRKFASYITPLWPTTEGESLLRRSVQDAVATSLEAMEYGEAITGRLVGVFLHRLAASVPDVARLAVCGIDDQGRRLHWDYFSAPLKAWADSHGMTSLTAYRVEPEPSDVTVAGLRTHLLASIAHPQDAGYVAKYGESALRHCAQWGGAR